MIILFYISLWISFVYGQDCVLEINTYDTTVVAMWTAIGNLFQDTVKPTDNPLDLSCCIPNTNEVAMNFLQKSFKLGCAQTEQEMAGGTKVFRETVKVMKTVCTAIYQPNTDPQSQTWILRNKLLHQSSLRLLMKSFALWSPARENDPGYNAIRDELQIMYFRYCLKVEDEAYWDTKNVLANKTVLGPKAAFLGDYHQNLAVAASLFGEPYYSITMNSFSAYAPILRSNRKIMYLENIDDTLTLITNDVLQLYKNNDHVFIYDDADRMEYFFRELRYNAYIAIKLNPDVASMKDKLIEIFNRGSSFRTFVMVFKRTTTEENLKNLVALAFLHKQVKIDIHWILVSPDYSCDLFNAYRDTNASMFLYKLSNESNPEQNLPTYSALNYKLALFIDGVTFMTKKSQYPSDYVLSPLNFQDLRPEVNPIEAVAIYDCTQNNNKARGTWKRTRNPNLIFSTTNTTLEGRLLNVGFLNYISFFLLNGDRMSGFSSAISEKIKKAKATLSKPKVFDFNPNIPYYQDIQKAIEAGSIDFAIVPIPFSEVKSDEMVPTSAALTLNTRVVRTRVDESIDLILILRPFSAPLWIASVAMGIVFTLVLMGCGKLDKYTLQNIAEGESLSRRTLWQTSSVAVASAFSMTKLMMIPTKPSNSVLACVIWSFVLLILTLYVSGLILILFKVEYPSFADSDPRYLFYYTDKDSLIVIKNGIGYNKIIASLESQNIPNSGYTSVDSADAAYNILMQNPNAVLVASELEANFIGLKSCRLETIFYPGVTHLQFNYALRKSFAFRDEIDSIIKDLLDLGEINDAISIYFDTGACYWPSFKKPAPQILNVKEMASMWFLILSGLVISFVVLGLEFVAKHFVDKKYAERYLELKIGEVYEAQIIGIKLSGLSIVMDGRREIFFLTNSELHKDPTKVTNAKKLGLTVGDVIMVTYLGRPERDNRAKFVRHLEEDEE